MTQAPEGQAPSFFVEEQLTLLRVVLDSIIPPKEGLPGAGNQGAASYVDRVVGESAELKRLYSRGLASIEAASNALFSDGFGNLRNEQRAKVLRQVESDDPEFFERLVRHTYNAYYTDANILRLLGLEARPPQPKGHHLRAGDISLVRNVKKRGRAYREV